MNVIYVSPHFPTNYYRFCQHLRWNGANVLGIGDTPYDNLSQELKDCLTEYYRVDSMHDYDQMVRAVGYFTHKYGKIDWLESNNEFWLELDAALRTDFNITSGQKTPDMEKIKHKSAMKAYYAKAGIPTARYHLVDTLENGLKFVEEVGYPVIVKPDNGVGANATYKLKNEQELRDFYYYGWNTQYIMEEFINGEVCSFDSIVDSKGNILMETGNVTPISIMDSVNDRGQCVYYIVKELAEDVSRAGHACVEAFGVKSRCTHLEFFRLLEDKAGLGKKGDIIGLEVNMRPSGGYSPDMYNFANEVDVYKIWADMVAFDRSTVPLDRPHHYCAFCGRRDGKNFVMDHNAIMEKYGACMKMHGRIPEALSGAMANQMYMANFDTEEEMNQYYKDLLATY